MKPQICEHCGQEFIPSRGPSKNRRQRFCSMRCRGLRLSGEDHPNAKTQVNQAGYRFIWVGKEKVFEHRHVMEQEIGRRLLDTEVVHHVNGNKLDNRPGNLRVMASNAEHMTLHAKGFRNETHKQCRKCLEIKPRSEFDKGVSGRKAADPHFTQCKACRKVYYAERYQKGLTTLQVKGRPEWGECGHAVCQRCGMTDKPYRSRGLCTRCFYQDRKVKGLSC